MQCAFLFERAPGQHVQVRTAILLLTALGITTACTGKNSCLLVGENGGFGTNHVDKIEALFAHAQKLGLPTTELEAAMIVGAAYAASQVAGGQSGIPVQICLRAGQANDTEYRVLSSTGAPLQNWQSLKGLRAR